MNQFKKTLLCLVAILLPCSILAQTSGKKPRVIVMTDGEVDDHSSMVRFLLYTCDIDLQAVIETNSCYQKNGHSKEDWYEKQLDAYGKVYQNLIKHNPGYPTADEIRRKSFVGDEDFSHLSDVVSREERAAQKPGARVQYMPDKWLNTPGSDRIVEVLLSNDPSPVYIEVWGGGNTASKAFYKLKTEYPKEYERAVSKVVMYNIWYQDDAGNYIETYHPKVTMLYSDAFNKTWAYKIQTTTNTFIAKEVKTNHGQLGALYPQNYISEGDSPSFMYTMNTGLRNYENPSYGGWGGRFEKLPNFANVYADAKDDGDVLIPLKRWVNQVNNDFEARLDWCVADKYGDANHPPVVKFGGKTEITAKPGKIINLSAKGTIDPDGNKITFKWWQYKEAGTHDGLVRIIGESHDKMYFMVPKEKKEGTIHIILEVTDNGLPKLVSYQRIIIKVKP
ncbi:DUF1593 domain-containing protein [Pedobacter frigiditerrae]|uniref:DUF1593 domain-containing protein n=1 Tax=Pedobacter frigiditerrae TaxID=2530452 RepID=A0A4R0MPF0_9SPHI|nr:DUF1593 domain-containing protein [Pedobacter frigiditerrae]TCC88680.1 DUF1593 domain-containing protein [Pedobacter frigiditerrae]